MRSNLPCLCGAFRHIHSHHERRRTRQDDPPPIDVPSRCSLRERRSLALDVVVYGATGFVGRLTAEYLAAHAPDRGLLRPHGRSTNGSRRCVPVWAATPGTGAHQGRRRRSRLAREPGRPDEGRDHHRGSVPAVRDAAGRGLRPLRHPLRGPDRRGALHAPDGRPLARDRGGLGGPHRPRLRVRLHPVGSRSAAPPARPFRRTTSGSWATPRSW